MGPAAHRPPRAPDSVLPRGPAGRRARRQDDTTVPGDAHDLSPRLHHTNPDMSAREEFLAGERLEDVCIYLDADAVSNPEALSAHAESVDGGLVLVMPGDRARSAFQQATGLDPMAFAGAAVERDGEVARDLTGAHCPDAGEDTTAEAGEGGHEPRFIFAFAEGENPEAGGLYAEGDVIHAYVSCSCGAKFSEKWVV